MAHITIPAGEPLVSYTPGGSSTGPFNVTFPIFSTDDLNVMVNGSLLSSSDWVFTPTDTRTGGYQAGYITLNSATTYQVVIYRDATRSRTSDYASGPLDINTLNTDVDRTVARDQDLRMLIDRALRGPASDPAMDALPDAATRANQYLIFDADGQPTLAAYGVTTTPVSSFMATVLDDLSAGAALTTLGVSSFMQTVLDDADAAAARATLGVVGKVVVRVFTSSGTYTPNADMLYAIIECVGGGGGGGGCANSTAGNQGGAGGGGGGAYARKFVTASDVGASKTVTIGAAGAAGTAGNNNGAAGGDTSVGSLCVAKGGAGGSGAASNNAGAGGAGGTSGSSVGDVVVAGQPGDLSGAASIATVTIPSGRGGNSALELGHGGHAPNSNVNNLTGNPGTGYGGGGAGGKSGNGAGTAAGGAGTAGVVIITEFCK